MTRRRGEHDRPRTLPTHRTPETEPRRRYKRYTVQVPKGVPRDPRRPHARRRMGRWRSSRVPRVKRCTRCDCLKPRHMYHILRGSADGLQTTCIRCLDRYRTHKRRKGRARINYGITGNNLMLRDQMLAVPRESVDTREAQRALRWLQGFEPPPDHVICTRCGQVTHISNLAPSKSYKSGHENRCRRCKELARRGRHDPNRRPVPTPWRHVYLCTHTRKSGPLYGDIGKFSSGVNPYAGETYDAPENKYKK